MTAFNEWETFYVIVGSSAAALTGLQFVVMALIADLETPTNAGAVEAFGTPTIVHFCAVLLASAVLTAPWRTAAGPMILLAILGATGVVYSVIVARRARKQTDYKPVMEDWLFHVVLPAAAYGVVAAGACLIRADSFSGLFAVGAAVTLLLFVGIHNAWDSVTFIVLVRRQDKHGD